LMGLEAHVGPDLHHRNGGQISHAYQVVGGAGECEDPVHFAHSAMPSFSHERNRLQPAKAFVDTLPLFLADRVSRMPRVRPSIHSRRVVPGFAPRAASGADGGTPPQTHTYRSLCRRLPSAVGRREAAPSAAQHRIPPFRWLKRLPRPRSIRCGSPPTDSRCNSASTPFPRSCVPAGRRDRSWIHGCHRALLPAKVHRGSTRSAANAC